MEFVDTTPTQKGGVFIPSEALMINGRTIEEQISGYQTLTVTGRGPLPKKITAETPDGRDGQQFIEAYYTTRSIVVAYQIVADTAEDLIAKYGQLATILGDNEFTFNFKDDPDWYYTGTVSATSDLPVRSVYLLGTGHLQSHAATHILIVLQSQLQSQIAEQCRIVVQMPS